MPSALVIGLSNDLVRRVRGAVDKETASYRAGWVVEFLPNSDRNVAIRPGQIPSILERAAALEGATILAFSKQDGGTRKPIAAALRTYFRFRWADARLLTHIGHDIPAFLAGIGDALAEEEEWIRTVQPSSPVSPLLLPQGCFSANRPYDQLWQLVEAFGDENAIRGAAKAIEAFDRCYRKATTSPARLWTDERGLVFDHQGPYHATAPHPRDWKYSYNLPAGFHYDVKAASGRTFAVRDHAGSEHRATAGGHVNIDPHGHVDRRA